MSTESSRIFKKDNLDLYLKELAKAYKKLVGNNMPAEITLIGGAAIIERYDFRDMTSDIDAIINATSAIKDAINIVRDRYNLPSGWINADFQRTNSYSSKLLQYSAFYKTFNGVLNVRVVTGEYLIAMKLRAFRQYKNDLSDIIGILAEHEKLKDPITYEKIEQAVKNLYGSWDGFSDEAISFITNALSHGNYTDVYDLVRENEKIAKNELLTFIDKYPGELNEDNTNTVLQNLLKRKASKDNTE